MDRIYNFVSGAAAYLQVYMNGFAGIKLHFDRMEIKRPRLPPDTTKLKIKGVNYLSARFDVTVKEDTFSLTMRQMPKDDINLTVERDDGLIYVFDKAGDTSKYHVKVRFFIGTNVKRFSTVEIGINSTISIKEKTYPFGECTMPKNVIGVPRKMLSLMPLRERARANGARIITGCLLFAFIAVLCAFAFLLYKRHGTIFPSNAVRYVRNV